MCQTYFQVILYDYKLKYIFSSNRNNKQIIKHQLKNDKITDELAFVIS
jgi:hypothetical protein